LQWEVSEGMEEPKGPKWLSVRSHDTSHRALFSSNIHQSPSYSEIVSAR
jgi:hypothetical protein